MTDSRSHWRPGLPTGEFLCAIHSSWCSFWHAGALFGSNFSRRLDHWVTDISWILELRPIGIFAVGLMGPLNMSPVSPHWWTEVDAEYQLQPQPRRCLHGQVVIWARRRAEKLRAMSRFVSFTLKYISRIVDVKAPECFEPLVSKYQWSSTSLAWAWEILDENS